MAYTKTQCKLIILSIARKYNISPVSIATKLLNKQDKDNLMNGLISMEVLDKFVKVWINQGMPNVGNNEP